MPFNTVFDCQDTICVIRDFAITMCFSLSFLLRNLFLGTYAVFVKDILFIPNVTNFPLMDSDAAFRVVKIFPVFTVVI